jgi:hypothetical protein
MFKKLFCKHDFTILTINRSHGYTGILDYGDFDWIRTEICVICQKCGKQKSFFSTKTKTPLHTNIYIKFEDSIEKAYIVKYKILLLQLQKKYGVIIE